MNDYKNFCEFSVRPKTTPKYLMAKLLLITMYTVFIALYLVVFWVIFKLWALLILLPFIMFAMIRVTWRLVDIEYEYSIEAGVLKVAVIYGKAGRRVKEKVNISDMTLVCAQGEGSRSALNAPDIIEVKDYSAHRESGTAILCVYADKKRGKKRGLIIEANDEMLRIMRLCNPSAVPRSL